jgi:bifunctional non-homologous end joining protein LigD
MLASAGDPESIPGALMETKYDGHRMLAFHTAEGVRMYARSGADKTGKLPAIERWIAENTTPGTILDGEVIAPDAKGGDWAKVQNVLGASTRQSTTLQYVVFDLLAIMGEDVRTYTLAQRRLLLETLWETVDDTEPEPVRLAVQMPYEARHVATMIAAGFEGAIVKDPRGTYRSGKRDWVKIKATETEDVVVIGATAGKGKYEGQVGALIFGQYVDGHLKEIGQCSGMTDAERAEFTRLSLTVPWFWDAEFDGAPNALAGRVIEVQHMGRMPSGGWRHPQFLRLRDDKPAKECTT